MESARLVADLTVFFVQTVKRIIEAVGRLGTEYDEASREEFVREQVMALGAKVLFIENGAKPVPFEDVLCLAKGLGVPVRRIFDARVTSDPPCRPAAIRSHSGQPLIIPA